MGNLTKHPSRKTIGIACAVRNSSTLAVTELPVPGGTLLDPLGDDFAVLA